MDVNRCGQSRHCVSEKDPLSLGSPEYWRNLYAQCITLKEKEQLFSTFGLNKMYADEPNRSRATAGTVLQRCLTNVERFRNQMNKRLCVYELGMTTNPLLRFHFYSRGNYSKMSLLHVTTDTGVAQMLEAALIALHISERECRNERFGGDGPSTSHHDGPHFVYIVGARADGNKPIS